MAHFTYAARDSSGASLSGEIIASTEGQAVRLLRAEGKYVVNLRQSAERIDSEAAQVIVLGGGRVRREDIIFFFSQLSIMVETGVTLADAIHACLAQTPSGRFQIVLKEVLRNVESGEPFSAALANHPSVFGDFYVNLIRAAEASGGMAPMLRRCADYLTAQREVRKKVKSALTYPLILMVAATGVTAFLMTYVLPKFLSIYAGRRAALPTPTVILMAITDWLTAYWMYVVGGSATGGLLIVWFFRSKVTRPWADGVKLHIPFLGRILRKSYVTSALRTLGVLVESGVSMLDAVAITGALSGNYHFERLWSDVAGRLHRGDQLSAPLAGSVLMPRPVVQMIEAGEKSGRLGAVLDRLCDFLDEELRITIKTVTQMIEPLTIAVMGAIIGAIAIALLLPILTISKTIGQ
jgi:type IV pilus assembly protein PilC